MKKKKKEKRWTINEIETREEKLMKKRKEENLGTQIWPIVSCQNGSQPWPPAPFSASKRIGAKCITEYPYSVEVKSQKFLGPEASSSGSSYPKLRDDVS
jgi:hypothetical protein